MQRLITIYLDSTDQSSLGVREHLADDLNDGWKVMSVTPVGSAIANACATANDFMHSDLTLPGSVAGWLAVVLEK